jgi:hypothetical protein
VGCAMTCLSCQSGQQAELSAEMLIHFPGLKNIDNPGVFLFPKLLVCMNCGFSRFTVSETDLASVAKGVGDKSPQVGGREGDVTRCSGSSIKPDCEAVDYT